MPTFNITVELSAAEKAQLTTAAQSAAAPDPDAKSRADKWKAAVLSERGRTVDQIKRLYAVVMGFAVTTCVTSAYLCARQVPTFSFEIYSILFSQVFSFISLSALFYLGAERMLDRRYLQPNSEIPHWYGLWSDLATLGIAATWFVILANTFPSFPAPPGQPSNAIEAIRTHFDYFIINLGVLYGLDIVLLLLHGCPCWRKGADKAMQERGHAYGKWISINFASFIAVLFLILRVPYQDPIFHVNLGALLLVIWHLIRFIIDFSLTFEFYYPSQDPKTVPPEF